MIPYSHEWILWALQDLKPAIILVSNNYRKATTAELDVIFNRLNEISFAISLNETTRNKAEAEAIALEQEQD